MRGALAGIGRFPPAAVSTARLRRLRGLTNRVYKVEVDSGLYCLRIPGSGTSDFIDRRAEEVNARSAAAAGIGPEVLHFGADGIMLTPFIGGAPGLSAERFRQVPGSVERAARALRRLHRTAGDFAREFNVFDIADRYIALLRARGADIPAIVAELTHEADELRLALAAHHAELRPCHCDPTGANLLDTGERVWLVDWEYSGMNDPFWDLAYLSIQSDFDLAMERALLAEYLGRAPEPRETSRMAVYLVLVELLSALWALVQHSGGNDAADFEGYARSTFEKCLTRMRSPELREHIQTVRRG